MIAPLLTIITVNFNDFEGLKKTLESVATQKSKNFEYLVIDGGSKDNSPSLLNQYKEIITYSVSEPDTGIYNAMNKGIHYANGKYLLFLNSGDILFDDDVVTNVTAYLESNIDCISGNLFYIEKGVSYTRKHPEKLTFSYIMSRTISHPSTFIKKELFEVYGYYNEKNKIVSDWEFFFKVLGLNGASYKSIDVTITNFDMTGISSTNHELVLKEKKEVLQRYLPTIFNNEYDSYIFDKFIASTRRIKLLQEIDKSVKVRKITSFLLTFLSRIAKLVKLL